MLIDKLIDYCKYDTQSDENSTTCPSTEKQKVLGKHLLDELNKLGLTNTQLDEYGYVYGYLDGDHSKPTIGLNAHMDTSPDASGFHVNPRIIENYDGKDIQLNNHLVSEVSRFPQLKNFVGKTLVVTDGNTLLGADDKAGIAIIMQALEEIINKQLPHGPIWVCFSPDEEIGRGTDKFNYDLFKVDFAYTIDGDDPAYIEYENFNAASAQVKFTGISVHPGSAKDKMVNAIKLAFEFNSSLDPNMVPEHTASYEGFNHMTAIQGDVSSCELNYIIRNHDYNKLLEQKQSFLDIEKKMNNQYGYECVKVTLKDGYRNMKEKFADNMYPIDLVRESMEAIGMKFQAKAIRGGTDGANMTWHGVLCPNLGTGGGNYHGVHEYWCKQDGEKAVQLLLKAIELAKLK